MNDTDFELELWNHQNEMIVLGTLFSKPEEVGFTYIDAIKNSDFHDPAMRFYHALFNDYILTYSVDLTETKMNMFCSMNTTRMQGYKKFGMYKTIKELMRFAVNSNEEMKQQVGILKKWSVLRGIEKNGYDVSKLLAHPKFNSMTADECANTIRGNLDKVCSRIITGIDDPIDLSDNAVSLIDNYLETPEKGYQLAWDFLNKACAGIMPGDSLGVLAASNSGKGRSLIYLATHLALVEKVRVGFVANEMSAESMKNAEISVILNAPAIQNLHGNELCIQEKRFKTGAYKNNDGDIIYRRIDDNGSYTETIEQFKSRLEETSCEYRGVKSAMKWFEENGKGTLLFKNCSADYSDMALQRLIRQLVLSRGVEVWCYDTLKHGTGSDMSKWSDFVATTTKLCELNQTLKSAAILSAQMNNSVFQVRPEEVNSSSIASGSYIYHLFDQMIVLLHIKKEWYGDYVFRRKNKDGSYTVTELNPDEHLTSCSLIKNRRGGKAVYLLNTDLDRNLWTEKKNGILLPKERKKKNDLMW